MNKQFFKKFVPATYSKVESTSRKLLSDIKKQLAKKSKLYEKEHLDIINSLMSIIKNEQEIISLCNDNSTSNKMITDSLVNVNNSLKSLNDNFKNNETKLMEITKEQSTNNSLINDIKATLACGIYLYNNNYERRVISSFNEMYEQTDFKEKFLKLIDGLENSDIEQIVLILQRQQQIKNTMDKELDIFTAEEQQQILKIKHELNNQIFKVSDDMYCFKHYFLPINHFEASVFCYKHGIDCIENIEKLKEKDILDVGGFIGDSILVLKPLTNRRIISFEAVEKHYELMKRTVEMNHLNNVILERMALGSENGYVDIQTAGSASAISWNGVVKVDGTETVPMRTLDEYLKDSDIDVGLIKVDIEGAEQSFLKGARQTIEKFKPVLLLSIYHNADDFFNIKPMIESWNLGYKFRIHKPVDYSVSREVLLIAENY